MGPSTIQCSTSMVLYLNASPKTISGRTSYCRVPWQQFSRSPEATRLDHLCRFWYGSLYNILRSFSCKLASSTSLLSHLFAPHHALHLVNGFSYLPAMSLGPESINRVRLAFSVTPSFILRVQEYQPVVHRLRLSASS